MLRQSEPLRMDAERLASVYLELGEARAQTTMARAMDEITVALARLKGLVRAGRLGQLADVAQSMRDIAEPLGLNSLARVAHDLADLSARRDPVALAAVMARMDRVVERTLKMVWDLQDLSG